jgi:16S rRNA (cytidine1402-2'-O)-methyltransferase
VGTLYLVSTPIGNLEDISARGLRILREARLIAAEDRRQTQKLLNHYGISTRLISYHAHSPAHVLEGLLSELASGDVALVSDAGTPVLNDPGYELVCAALGDGYPVSPIPGPNAPIAALVASGLPPDAFLYLGYLPRKAGDRRRLLEQIAPLSYTLIFLEAPHRIQEALADLEDALGDRQVAVAREITKVHEEFFRGRLSQARARFASGPPRGEFTLVLAGSSAKAPNWNAEQVQAAIREKIGQGLPPTQVARQLAAQSGWPRRALYQLIKETEAEFDHGPG